MSKSTILEIPFSAFAKRHRLASKQIFDTFYPAVTKCISKTGTITYSICVKTGESWRGNYTTVTWDYFVTDSTGLILQSPRGMAKQYNKKVRLIDLEKAVEEYKEKAL